MKTENTHSFHIPVMGLAYTIDSPIRVAHRGISSVISVMDDELIERMNRFYSKQYELPYKEISSKTPDFRAKRITSYLNTVDNIVSDKFRLFKKHLIENKNSLEEFISTLPNISTLREELSSYLGGKQSLNTLRNILEEHFHVGSIDVNIMTKVDREHYQCKELLPTIYNDAHAALRGFAQSNLNASVVLSAGMNPRLFSYFEEFPCFYPTPQHTLSKKIILKVSDYRSALIQGQQLAKKGLWVSEYRIESGLNCGGHAFATDGLLLGTILETFKEQKTELIQTTHDLLCKALADKNLFVPEHPLDLKITAQGGVGTAEEHNFLLQHYEMDSVGWGSPFLLVPEATSTDVHTRKLLADATENDLYLSTISPLGIPFNTVKNSTNEFIRNERIAKNNPGSACPRKYLALNKNYDSEGTCTASRKHQKLALKELKEQNLSEVDYNKQFNEIVDKACLCIGLANPSLMEHNLEIKGEAQGVVVCPGPNMAYFTKEATLKQMMQHIYGNINLIEVTNRPHFFIKELSMYMDHFFKEKEKVTVDATSIKLKKLSKLKDNLMEGIAYYENLFSSSSYFESEKGSILSSLHQYKNTLNEA